MIPQKRALALVCAAVLLLCGWPFAAHGDDAGVLSEMELNVWLQQLLRATMAEQPQNAPVGEESLTEDGYAFIYSTATLYYDKPTLDASSKLRGLSVTEESFVTPRGIALGSPVQLLVDTYGWQNPLLMGDGSFASFYALNQLPQAAYWAWAQHEGPKIQSVQCAMHVRIAEGVYTDAGILYQVENDLVTGIRVYGLQQSIGLNDVEANLSTVTAVQTAGSGDEPAPTEEPVSPPPANPKEVPQSLVGGKPVKGGASGTYSTSVAEEFSAADLRFGGLYLPTCTQEEAIAVFGPFVKEEWVQDESGEWLHTLLWNGASMTFVLDYNKQHPRAGMLSITSMQRIGPRGIQVGNSLEQTLLLLSCKGVPWTEGVPAFLYGDGATPPYAVAETSGAYTSLRYVAVLPESAGGPREVTLYLAFTDKILTEMMIYAW